jgi:hypothetical protein
MNAANDLAPFSEPNVDQMERVASNPQVRFVVQWKQSRRWYPQSIFEGTRRYLVRPDTASGIRSQVVQDMGDAVDMGDPATLNAFIGWAQTFYPARRYALIVWNHGNGWLRSRQRQQAGRAFSYDDEFRTAIQLWQIPQALGNRTFDIVAWDASLMQMSEVVTELEGRAKYVVGSEESPPGAGYPYDLIFDKFRANPTLDTPVLARSFADGMIQRYGSGSERITQSVVDVSKMPSLQRAISNLGNTLRANRVALASVIQGVRNDAQAYSPRPDRVYRDLWHVADLFEARSGVTTIQTACRQVKSALAQAVIYERHNNSSPNSRGLSIDFSDAEAYNGYREDYERLRFSSQTSWNEWLQVAP